MDVLLFFHGHAADLRVAGRDLEGDDTLYTSVLVSLFTDARADDADELPPELLPRDGSSPDLRGFWGDALNPEGHSLGSKLWLLRREKQRPQIVARAERYARDALAWLVADGHAAAVDVSASVPRNGWLALDVAITLPSPLPCDKKTRAWNFTYSLGDD